MSGKPSAAWYLVPLFLGIVGSVIMWFVLKNNDHPDSPKMIKKGWIIGIILTVIDFAWMPLMMTPFAFMGGMDQQPIPVPIQLMIPQLGPGGLGEEGEYSIEDYNIDLGEFSMSDQEFVDFCNLLKDSYDQNDLKVYDFGAYFTGDTIEEICNLQGVAIYGGAANVPAEKICDPSYPDMCIAPYPPDLDCGEIRYVNFRVLQPDPHGFDPDKDGIGCER